MTAYDALLALVRADDPPALTDVAKHAHHARHLGTVAAWMHDLKQCVTDLDALEASTMSPRSYIPELSVPGHLVQYAAEGIARDRIDELLWALTHPADLHACAECKRTLPLERWRPVEPAFGACAEHRARIGVSA